MEETTEQWVERIKKNFKRETIHVSQLKSDILRNVASKTIAIQGYCNMTMGQSSFRVIAD